MPSLLSKSMPATDEGSGDRPTSQLRTGKQLQKLQKGEKHGAIMFMPAGFNLAFHFGVAQCLMDHNVSFQKVVGLSAGTMAALAMIGGASISVGVRQTFDLALEPAMIFGTFRNFFRTYRGYFRAFRQARTPEGDLHLLENRYFVGVRSWRRGLFYAQKFANEDELENAIMCSNCVHGLLSCSPLRFRGEWCFDNMVMPISWPEAVDKMPRGDDAVRVIVMPMCSAILPLIGRRGIPHESDILITSNLTWGQKLRGCAGDPHCMMLAFIDGYKACSRAIDTPTASDEEVKAKLARMLSGKNDQIVLQKSDVNWSTAFPADSIWFVVAPAAVALHVVRPFGMLTLTIAILTLCMLLFCFLWRFWQQYSALTTIATKNGTLPEPLHRRCYRGRACEEQLVSS